MADNMADAKANFRACLEAGLNAIINSNPVIKAAFELIKAVENSKPMAVANTEEEIRNFIRDWFKARDLDVPPYIIEALEMARLANDSKSSDRLSDGELHTYLALIKQKTHKAFHSMQQRLATGNGGFTRKSAAGHDVARGQVFITFIFEATGNLSSSNTGGFRFNTPFGEFFAKTYPHLNVVNHFHSMTTLLLETKHCNGFDAINSLEEAKEYLYVRYDYEDEPKYETRPRRGYPTDWSPDNAVVLHNYDSQPSTPPGGMIHLVPQDTSKYLPYVKTATFVTDDTLEDLTIRAGLQWTPNTRQPRFSVKKDHLYNRKLVQALDLDKKLGLAQLMSSESVAQSESSQGSSVSDKAVDPASPSTADTPSPASDRTNVSVAEAERLAKEFIKPRVTRAKGRGLSSSELEAFCKEAGVMHQLTLSRILELVSELFPDVDTIQAGDQSIYVGLMWMNVSPARSGSSATDQETSSTTAPTPSSATTLHPSSTDPRTVNAKPRSGDKAPAPKASLAPPRASPYNHSDPRLTWRGPTSSTEVPVASGGDKAGKSRKRKLGDAMQDDDEDSQAAKRTETANHEERTPAEAARRRHQNSVAVPSTLSKEMDAAGLNDKPGARDSASPQAGAGASQTPRTTSRRS